MVLALACAVVAAIVAGVIGIAAKPIGTALGLLDYPDDPGGRKLHAGVTPLVGGLAVTLAALGALAAVIALGPDHGAAFDRDMTRLAASVAAMYLIGAADDRFELGVVTRLAVATVILAYLVATVPDFAISFVRFGRQPAVVLLGWTAIPLTLLSLVGLLNAVNMADGKNGIVIGLALIWSAYLLVHVPPALLPVMSAVAAALAVLFVFNLRGRLFLGDGGGYAISAFFGLLVIAAYNHGFADIGADDVALLFAVPVFDLIRLVFARIMQRRSPFHGGRDHLHHYLYAALGWPRGLYVYLTLAALPILGASLLPGTGLVWIGINAVAYAAVLVWIQRR